MENTTNEQCEMCLRKVKGIHEEQCLRCHIEICDEPLSECIGKQMAYKKMGFWDREISFDDKEIKEAKQEGKI